MADVEKKNL